MLSSSFLDVAIGIVFVFLLLSLIASTVNEIVFSFFNMRGRTLLEGIRTLLSDPTAEGLVKEIYNHGQVFGLFKGDFNPGKSWKDAIPLFRTTTERLGKCTRDNLPSYIPTTNFVMAFLGVLPGAAKTASVLAAKQAADARTNADKARAAAKDPNDKDKQDAATKADVAAAKAEDLADRAKQGAEDVESALAAAEKAQAALKAAAASSTSSAGRTTADAAAAQLAISFQSLKAVAEALSNNPNTVKVGKPLLAMVVTAGNDFDKLKTSIEAWYNSAMDRVSGWYKYNTQKMLFWIGLVLAIALNANTIVIVQQLSKNPTLRESIVAAAQSAVAEKKSGPGNTPAPGNDAAPGSNPGQVNTPDLGKQLKDVSDQIKEVEDLGIPLGWPARSTDESWWDRNSDALQRPGTWIGWLFTAIAVSLGAPFWFDMLNKIMIVRSTVKPGEKSPPAKDKEKR
jgi:hypothetical protein